ncbi:MAG: hypothetical protein ABIT38_18300 [Gemmatimonadaceae bacterium]
MVEESQGGGELVTLRVTGGANAYRLLDVGYAISLEHALDLLATSAPERVRPVRGEGAAMQIPNPPVSVILGTERLVIGGAPYDAEVAARIFDFGVVSLRVSIVASAGIGWEDFTRFGSAVDSHAEVPLLLEHHARLLFDRIRPAIDRPSMSPVREEYVVFRLRDAFGENDARLTSDDFLSRVDVAPLLLNESRPLARLARAELLQHRFSYYEDDLTLVTWDNALVLDPDPVASDVEYILEFANAQLLELRYYDAILDAEIPKLYDRIEAARSNRLRLFSRRFSNILGELQRLFADSTELVERVENSLKVTDDVYLSRVYLAALEIFRGRVWRAGVDRKLSLVRETYEMLNAESQAARSEALEVSIVVLIVAEIVLALLR